MENKNHILKRVVACVVVVFVAVTATIMSNITGLELPKWSEMFVTRASAVDKYTSGYYTYSVSNGKATITDVNDSISGSVTIPSKLGGYPVIGIGDSVFKECTGLTSVTIPDSVTSIGKEAFDECTGLKILIIGKSVTSIGDYAFSECSGLTKIYWNAGNVSKYGYNVFEYAGNGMDVIFGNSVKRIPNDAFSYTNICGFHESVDIKSVTIPNSVTSIGEDAFHGCTGLTSVTIGNSITSIGEGAFENCTGLKSVTIPNSVTSIGRYAFACTGLTSVTIPAGVTSIGTWAFGGCARLTKIYWNAERVHDLSGDDYEYDYYDVGIFSRAGSELKVVFGDNVKTIPAYAFGNCTGLQSVTIGKSITSIGACAFRTCTGLTSVTIPDNVRSIDWNAFGKCTRLKSVTIGKGVKSIGEEAFLGCTGLKSVNISDLSAWIKIVFGDCYSNPLYYGAKLYINGKLATNIIIPDGITSIRDCAFSGYTGLKSVTIGKSVKNIGNRAFYACSGLTSVTIPDSVTSIGHYTFYKCTGLKSVTIGKNLKKIGGYVFNKCTGLTRINWNAEKVHGMCFIDYDDYCIDVFGGAGTAGDGIQVVFGDSVKMIPDYMFDIDGDSKRPKIKTVTIGKNVKYIGDEAFYDCTGLTSVTIPDSVTKIGSKAFGGFNAQIKFTGKPPVFSSDTFSGLKGTVLYPYKISEWKSAIKSKYGGQFTWVCYSKGKLTELKIKSMPKKTVYYQGQTANYSGLSLSAKWSDGFSAVITPDSKIYDVTISGFSSKTPGLKTVTATVGGKSVKFRLGVHKLNTFTESKSKYPESAHNYANNLKETKTYKCTNALRLVVTFSNKTYVEKDGDYIYVNGTRYTENQLAGKTITIKGDTLTVKLVSDDYGRGYGYSIDKIVVTRVEHINKTRITPATATKDGTVVTACEACGKVAKKAVIYKASSVRLSRTAYTYNGKIQKPTVTVKNSKGSTLKNGTHYTVTYSSGCKNPGKYAVKITFKGYYTGTKTLYFTIAPATPTLTVTAGAKKAALKWNKQVGATGYVVYMATSKTGKYSRIAVLKGNSAVSYTKTGLTTGKTYYFKVAAYTTSGGSNIYSSFSAVKGIKVK